LAGVRAAPIHCASNWSQGAIRLMFVADEAGHESTADEER
jgi:hypothetical protein